MYLVHAGPTYVIGVPFVVCSLCRNLIAPFPQVIAVSRYYI